MDINDDPSWQVEVLNPKGGKEREISLRFDAGDCIVNVVLNPVEAAHLTDALRQASERARRETNTPEVVGFGLGQFRPT